MPHPTPPKTVDDFFALQDEGETELLDGEFVVSAAPNLPHQRAIVRLLFILEGQLRQLKIGKASLPIDVELSRTTVVHPDVVYLSNATLKRIKGHLFGPPDLAVEFLSPSNRSNDLKRKMKLYLEHGVPQYWIGDPDARTIRVLENAGKAWKEKGIFKPGDVIRPSGMPGVIVEVSEVFEEA
jgi:Uma2 family endonuclease